MECGGPDGGTPGEGDPPRTGEELLGYPFDISGKLPGG